MAARTCERTPAWAVALLGWIVGAGWLEWRGAAWSAPPVPPVCSVESPGSPGSDRASRRPPGPRELRSIPGVGQVRAVVVARHLLEHSGWRVTPAGLPTLADLTGIPGVGPVIGGRLLDHFARRETPRMPP